MPTLKIVNGYGKYQDDNAIHDAITYIWLPWKIPHGVIGGTNVDLSDPVNSMIAHAMNFNKYSRTRLRHYILSFDPQWRVDLGLLARAAAYISENIGKVYPNVYAVHEDKVYYHIHFIVSPISVKGYRYRGSHDEYRFLLFQMNVYLHGFNLGNVIPVKYKPDESENNG